VGDFTHVPLNVRARGVSSYDYLLLFIGTTSGAIMFLMTVSLFSPTRALALGLLLTLIGAIFLREDDDAKSFFNFPNPWLLGCVLLALLFRGNFATNYVGGQDPGAYVNFSGIIGHFGGLYFPDTFRNTLPDDLKQLYDRAPIDAMAQIWPVGDGLRFQAAWYPLHPGWMALFSGLFGADRHGLSMLLFSLLGVTGSYYLTLELAGSAGRPAARLAAVLLAINPALCFMAKFPLTEAQTAALLLNGAYLLAKGIKAEGRSQLFLLASSFGLVLAFFFTRLSFPILAVPWAALYVLSCSQWIDVDSARRLRVYLWLLVPAGVLVGLFYYTMLPKLFEEILVDTYWQALHRHAIIVIVAAVAFVGLNTLAIESVRYRLRPFLEFAILAVERAAPWLPIIIVLASLPSALDLVKTGHLFANKQVVPEPAGFRYHTIYRWMLTISPFQWVLFMVLPALVKWPAVLTTPMLFLCGTLALTEVYAPSLPYLYYYGRYLCSEVIPFGLVIMSIVLVTMWHMSGWRRYLTTIAVVLTVVYMGTFSALQIRREEGQDPRFFHELDAAIASKDVMLLSQSDDLDISVPLRYFFNKQIFIIPRDATKVQVQEIFDYFLKNSGSKYGRILLLSQRQNFRLPLGRTIERLVTYTDSVISNSEHWRSGEGFQSHRPGRMILPYAWRTSNTPYTLYRVNYVAVLQPILPFGCPIDFSESGNSELFVQKGWSDPEARLRWTDGSIAALRMRFEPQTNTVVSPRLLVEFQAVPFGASQRTRVIVDGKQAAELKLMADRQDYEVEVDLENLDINIEHEIVFSLPDAHSPESVGMSHDGRQLGMAMKSLTVFDGEKAPGQCH
jgi:hypothetical protein